jgi:hypothetical protein
MPRLLSLSAITMTQTGVFRTHGGVPPDITLRAPLTGRAAAPSTFGRRPRSTASISSTLRSFRSPRLLPTAIYNLTSETPVTSLYSPTDGTLDANTSVSGLIGPWWRIQYKSAGTAYAGGTSLTIDAIASGVRLIPTGWNWYARACRDVADHSVAGGEPELGDMTYDRH